MKNSNRRRRSIPRVPYDEGVHRHQGHAHQRPTNIQAFWPDRTYDEGIHKKSPMAPWPSLPPAA